MLFGGRGQHWVDFRSIYGILELVMYSYGPPHMAVQKQDDQHDHTFSNYVRIRDVVLKTCRGQWTIGKSGERGSEISVLPARHDDDWVPYCVQVSLMCHLYDFPVFQYGLISNISFCYGLRHMIIQFSIFNG